MLMVQPVARLKSCRTAQQVLTSALAGILGMAMLTNGALAQSYPSKPVRFVVPYPPGGGTDIIARIVREPLAAALNATIVIDNRGGAGGSVGTEAVAKSPADGYTLLFTLSSHTINPGLFARLGFDTEKDFAAISMVASLPQILVANPKFAATNLRELIEMAKAKPRSIDYASVGLGSPSHMAGELLDMTAGTRMQHVPYRGGGPALIDLLGGHVPLLWVSIPVVAGHAGTGEVRPLAVSTLKRSALLPNVPTVAESGFPGFEVDSWYAMFAPHGTPRPIIDTWHKAIADTVKQPGIREKLLAQGAEGISSTPEHLDKVVKEEIVKWGDIIRKANIKPQ